MCQQLNKRTRENENYTFHLSLQNNQQTKSYFNICVPKNSTGTLHKGKSNI